MLGLIIGCSFTIGGICMIVDYIQDHIHKD